jgi:hypothetical protein
MKTVAAGTTREAPAGFLALIWSFSIAVESMYPLVPNARTKLLRIDDWRQITDLG